MTKVKQLTRSRANKMIAGVCAGIANYFDLDPALVRIGFILVTLMGGAGVVAYLILWLALPAEGSKTTDSEALIKENATEIKERAEDLAATANSGNSKALWGVFLVGLGVVFLLQNFGFFRFLDWGKIWPVVLIILGFVVLTKK